MSTAKNFFDHVSLSSPKSRRIRIIKNLMYFISLFDFLIHYALTIELNVFGQLSQALGKVSRSNSTAISLCHLPIKQYLPVSLSDLSLYLLYISILVLFISIEAIRKSSISLYRFYMVMKFLMAIMSFALCMIYMIIDRRTSFVIPSLIISSETNSIAVTVDACLMHIREKLAITLLSIVNMFIFFLSLECSKVFSLIKIKFIQI